MADAEYPSAAIPGIPRFAFAVPEGWVIDSAPGTLCVVRQAVADDDGFWAEQGIVEFARANAGAR